MPLMGNDILLFLCWDIGGQIDFGGEDAHNKWRVNIIGTINVSCVSHSAHQFPSQADILHDAVKNHAAGSGDPDIRNDCHNIQSGMLWLPYLRKFRPRLIFSRNKREIGILISFGRKKINHAGCA